MQVKSSFIAVLMVMTQAGWMIQIAHAQHGEHDKPEHSQKQNRQEQHRNRPAMPMHETQHGGDAHSYTGHVPIGGYFQQQHRDAARDYDGRAENRGFCPTGLAKKGNGCLPPGQAKKWRQGYALPPHVIYDEVPRSVVLTLGAPPSGYRYVRVASDILLIAVGTRIVVDAIEDLVR
jgi:Ni/Co efflux regulator RcnB